MRSVKHPPRSTILTVMTRAVFKAAKGLVRDFGELEHLQVARKGPKDFVSNADLSADKTLKEELQYARPDWGFLTEESGTIKGNDPDYRWVVDPLDGTKNYLHGIPHWAISVALEHKGEIIAAVIFDPIKNEMFCAEKGGGATMNDRRLRVAQRKHIGDTLIAAGGIAPEVATRLNKATAGVRKFGAAALNLAYVALGRFDAYIAGGDAHWWDVAAGILIVKESGGYVTDLKGAPPKSEEKSLIATNPFLHTDLMKTIRG